MLLECAPHAVLAGMNACAKAIGATHGVVYIRGEYPFAAAVMANAIAEAVAQGFFVPGFQVEIHQGKGSYVCGEETALLRAIEGQRAEPTPKPPYPAESGLYSKPTVVQNIETLTVVPWFLATGQKPSTKAFSLSGAVQEAGAVEAGLGITLQELLHQGAAGPKAGLTWKMALVGCLMGRVVPANAFASTILSYEAFPGRHGGVVVMDGGVSAKQAAHPSCCFCSERIVRQLHSLPRGYGPTPAHHNPRGLGATLQYP